MKSTIARFITLEALKELAHSMDTCANESFNNTVSWVAPKNKVLCGTSSLRNRVIIALGITTLGTVGFFTGLFTRLNILMYPDIQHFLKVVGGKRQKRLDKTKTPAFKKKKQANEYAKLRKFTAEATEARAKREGVYKPGIGMTGGYDEKEVEDVATSDDNKKPAAKRRRQLTAAGIAPKACLSCGGTDHQRTSSQKCPHYTGRKKTKLSGTANEAEDNAESKEIAAIAAAEMDKMDGLALGVDEEEDSIEYFSAASEFS